MIKLAASIRTNDFNVPNHLHNYFLTAETAAVPKAGTVSRPLAGLISAFAWLQGFRRSGRARASLSALSIALAILTLTAAQAAGDIIAHWDFNETGGDIARSSVGGHQGQMYGGASFVTEGGIEGGALSLERDVNSYVDTGPWFDFVDRDFSLQAWVRTNPGDTSDLFVVGQHNSGSLNGIILFVNGINPVERRDGSAGFYASARQQDVLLSGTDVNDGNWHQLVSVYRVAGNVELYVDGANLESSALAQTINPNTASFLIGGITFGSTPGGGFDGLIDEVQVYDYALAAHEIQFLYENPGLALGESRTPGDTDADGDVDLDDLNNVRNTFGQTGDPLGDANHDGVVDLDDLNAVRNHFGTAGAAAVPEPPAFKIIMIALVGIASGTLLRHRRPPMIGRALAN